MKYSNILEVNKRVLYSFARTAELLCNMVCYNMVLHTMKIQNSNVVKKIYDCTNKNGYLRKAIIMKHCPPKAPDKGLVS